MRDKTASLSIDGVRYLYSIRPLDETVRIHVYRSDEKVPLFTVSVSYAEAWGFDVYRPRMIEILIRYFLKNNPVSSVKRLKISEHPKLFEELLDCFFAGSSERERAEFVRRCRESRKRIHGCW